MTSDAIQAEVMEYVAVTAEVKLQLLLPETRLLHDLGIDGDDAAQLFDGLHKRFGTDLTHLYEHWSEHLGPEGIPLSAGLIAAVAGGFLAIAIGKVAGSAVAIIVGTAATLVLIASMNWIARKLGVLKELRPITVSEVVQAVEAGAWPVQTR